MSKINLNKIIEFYDLDAKVLSSKLFPDHKYPLMAFNRILSGESYLDSNQLETLAKILNITVGDLYLNDWSMGQDDGKMTFTNEDYRAVIDLTTWTSILYKKDTKISEKLIVNKLISFSDYIKSINLIIKNLENGEN